MARALGEKVPVELLVALAREEAVALMEEVAELLLVLLLVGLSAAATAKMPRSHSTSRRGKTSHRKPMVFARYMAQWC